MSEKNNVVKFQPVPTPRIVGFGKDWNDVPTSATHVLRGLGKLMPVLWIESIGTRKAQLGTAKDWTRIWRRVCRAFRGAEARENHIRVLAPLVVPKAQSKVGQWLNRWLIRLQIRGELRRMGQGPVEYWCFVPNAVDLLPGERSQKPESRIQNGSDLCGLPAVASAKEGLKSKVSRAPRVIYYCVDDWSQFHNLDGAWLARKEEELLRRADVVFAVSRFLVEKLKRIAGDKVVYMPHGADHAHFAQALDPDLAEPADIAALPHPRLGFYGNLYSWVDLDLVEKLAAKHPEWSLVLIGQIYCDVSRLWSLPNIHLLGRREHRDLPFYCKGFDVAIIPYDMRQSRMQSVNPTKTKELLAAGVPIVAPDIPELRPLAGDIALCRTFEEWERAIEAQRVRKDRKEISQRVAGEGWNRKVAAMRELVSSIEIG